MKKLIGLIVISSIVSVIMSIMVYRYVPLSLLETKSKPVLGTTITTIQGTDTISGTRTVLNNMFSSININKFELSDWFATTSAPQLTTLGIMSGGLVTVAYGGTASSSPTSNQIMIGNGASGFKVIGFGSSGQFLTSGGNATTPSWTTGSVDGTLNYNFTGTNHLVKNLSASSTVANPLILNTVSYNTPSSQGGLGTQLQNDGSGNLTWTKPLQYSLVSGSAVTANTGFATSTLLSIPAGVMTASSTIAIHGTFACTGGTTQNFKIVNGNGSAFVSSANSLAGNCATTNVDEVFDAEIYPNYASNAQKSTLNAITTQLTGTTGNQQDNGNSGTSSFDLTSAFSVGIQLFSNGNNLQLKQYSIIITP